MTHHAARPVVLAALAVLTAVAAPQAAVAASAPEPGSVGQVTVTPTNALPTEGAVVTVTGTGFDPTGGVYVAVCLDNGPGKKPSPCIGGADTEGIGGAVWISSTPPSYAEGLTVPYGPDGSFEVQLPVPAVDEVSGVDCRVDPCAVTVRFDHLRADDRSADHVVPISFADGTEAPEDDATATTEPEPTPSAEHEPEATPTPVAADDGAGTGGSGPSPVVWVVLAAVLAIGAFVVRARRDRGGPADPTD